MNRALLDTDILSYYFKGEANVEKKIMEYYAQYGFFEISILTYYEIISGLNYKKAFKQLNAFNSFVKDNRIITLSEASCKISADIYSGLRLSGTLIDDIDLLIAGIAIANDLTLITNNENHFSRIPNLKIDNWKKC